MTDLLPVLSGRACHSPATGPRNPIRALPRAAPRRSALSRVGGRACARTGSPGALGKFLAARAASPEPFVLVTSSELEQPVERADRLVELGAGSLPDRYGPDTAFTVHAPGPNRWALRPTRAVSTPWRRQRVGRSTRTRWAIASVLVVVEEDAVALLLPPLRGRHLRDPPLDLAGERERRAADLGELPSRTDPYVSRGCHVFPIVFGKPTRPCSSKTSQSPSRSRARRTGRPGSDRGRSAARPGGRRRSSARARG